MKPIEYIKQLIPTLMDIDSPTGYTHDAIKFLKEECEALGYRTFTNHKGNLYVRVKGECEHPVIAYSAHCDTLGLMVRSIKSDGTLAITRIGGPLLSSLHGEYCKVYTRDHKVYTGTILTVSPSVHVFKDASNIEFNEENLIVRLDEEVYTKQDVEKLGICNGDFIAYDPKTVITEAGYIKSRFLDDKLSVAILMGLLYTIKQDNIVPKRSFYVCISTYEEVGHGASWTPEDVQEFISIDMGCIGSDLACKETQVSLCAKDSGGPYDYQMLTDFINVCKTLNIDYAVDIYPYYGSDTGASLKAGNNVKGGLIGPGVAASHGMERSHLKAVQATLDLALGYLNR